MSRHHRRASDGADAAGGGHAGYRHARLSRLLHEELEALVRDELDDPSLAGVRFTYLELSVDYKNAKVAFVSDLRDRERATRGLARVTPLLRARLAEAIDLKQVPLLRFVWDAYFTGGLTGGLGGDATSSLSSIAEETPAMRYEKPEVAEIKMDAEIGSYQNDFDPVPIAEPTDEQVEKAE